MSGSMMTLGLAAELMGARLSGGRAETGVTGVSTDSRTLTAGQLFFALGGPNFDGHEHVAAAAQAPGCRNCASTTCSPRCRPVPAAGVAASSCR